MENQDKQLEMFSEDKEEQENLEEAVQKKKEDVIITERGEEFSKEEWAQEVVPKGPTRQEVEEWKDKYGNIYFVPFDSDIYMFRQLNRAEYREVALNQDYTAFDKEEIITDKCVIFPRNFSVSKLTKGNAGLPTVLNEMIMSKSGFFAQSAPIQL
ncbi:hypothetical protein [Virgibacillus salexigens]|uniref:Uncharacterized protein n=1 Tax=Virgibacillus massiliensis TaxID=1462526 RepID=A0A024QHY1_9BACI|nr:hypothetical protein [Virgibacillus massiliensis]CDQ41810.1 hypothetical protein BN990_04187 [Virgibacillus massiliensis]